jgi:ABC-type bacteriocin/lantibiotic exporter with double-glycine peptidase domain
MRTHTHTHTHTAMIGFGSMYAHVLRKMLRQQREQNSEIAAGVTESLSHIKTLKVGGAA